MANRLAEGREVVHRFPAPMKNAFSNWDEERLVEAGRDYYATAFPNPERVGCPDGTTMQALGRRQVDRFTRQQIDSRMMQCSPCFNDYVRLREALDRSAQRRKLAAIAAVIALGIASWIVVRYLRGRGQEAVPGAVESGNVTYQAGLLDLRNKAAPRGSEANADAAAAVLMSTPFDLAICLPTGSEPGNYEVQVTQGPGQPLLTAQGEAGLRDHVAVLEVKLDLERLRPGLYLFWIRQGTSSWSYYPVGIQARP